MIFLSGCARSVSVIVGMTRRADQEFIDVRLMRHYLARARGKSPRRRADEISWLDGIAEIALDDRFGDRHLNWVNDRNEMIYND